MRRSIHLLALLAASRLCAQSASDDGLGASLDAVLQRYYDEADPGATALVALDGQVLWAGSVGKADPRARTAIDTTDVLRIGSLTKQFTATAIMQLAEEGMVGLQADIRSYIDFPKKEHTITVEHLLTHTSGIPNYTDLPTFTPKLYGKDVLVKDVVATFKDLPLEFEPGTQWRYSNSGYILLGLIIEKVSGLSYEGYLRENIFGPAGLTSTTASPANDLVEGEIEGFRREGDAWKQAVPISLSWPFAAGVIRSTVGDLNRWNTAVMGGRLVPPASMEKAFTEHTLKDGTPTHYGYGWITGRLQGTPTLEHGGSINGFSSYGLFVPQDAVYAVVLSNRTDVDAGAVAAELAAVVLGTPFPSEPYGVDTAALRAISGVYVSEKGVERYLTVEEGRLWSQRQGGSKYELRCVGQDLFRFTNDVLLFQVQRAGGKVTGARLRTRMGDEQLTRTDKPLPMAPVQVQLEPAMLERYAGVYELQPGFNITFRVDGTRFLTQATGQEEFEAFASGPTTFFLKVVDARIEFLPEPDGAVKRMKLFQGGAELEGRRVR
jgi:D-alanyl-D-alanine carboxypeptidase